MRDEAFWVKEARRREVKREMTLMQAIRFGAQATQNSYEDRMQQLNFELRQLDEEE